MRRASSFHRDGQGVFILSRNGAMSCATAAEAGKFERLRGGAAVEPQERRICPYSCDRSRVDPLRLCRQAFAPVSLIILDSF